MCVKRLQKYTFSKGIRTRVNEALNTNHHNSTLVTSFAIAQCHNWIKWLVRRAAAAPRLQTRYSLDGISNYSSEMVLCARNTQDSSRVSKVPKVKSYNLFTGYFYFINFIVGTGILNLQATVYPHTLKTVQ